MSPRADRGGLAVLVWLTLLAPTLSQAQAETQGPRSKQEAGRRKLLEEMGLEQTHPASPTQPDGGAPGTPGGARVEADHAGPESADAKKKAESGGDHRPSVSFRRVIHPLFLQTCKTCHVAGGAGATTSLVLTGDAAGDHAAIRRLLDLRAPVASPLLSKASGQKPHGGGAPWPTDGAAYARVLAWIQGGARLDGGGPESAAIAPIKSPQGELRPDASERAATRPARVAVD